MVTIMAAVRTGMALSEYLARSDERFELIDGEIVPMTPTYMGHDDLKQILFLLLYDYSSTHQLGDVFIERTFSVADIDDPKWVKGSLVPDVCFFAGTRIADYKTAHPDWRNSPMAVVPDLAIEVQSAGDSYPYVLRKVAYALSVGVQEMWVINQTRQSVTVHKTDGESSTLLADQTLSSGLLAGWSILVRNLFVDPSDVK